jgi:hypothetical protein
VDITGVEVIGDFQLRLTFQDGTVGDVDLERGVAQRLEHAAPLAAAESTSTRANPDAGTIAWPNGIDLAPEPLLRRSAPAPRPRVDEVAAGADRSPALHDVRPPIVLV